MMSREKKIQELFTLLTEMESRTRDKHPFYEKYEMFTWSELCSKGLSLMSDLKGQFMVDESGKYAWREYNG